MDQVSQNTQLTIHPFQNQEEKKNGNHGHKIWTTGLTNKLKLLKLEFHIIQIFNLTLKLILINSHWLESTVQASLNTQLTMHPFQNQEVKKNGNHGHKTWTTGLTNKPKLLRPEFHTIHNFNLKTMFHLILN